eukprot:6205801-Pleurochrysis_carterae.AAC.2
MKQDDRFSLPEPNEGFPRCRRLADTWRGPLGASAWLHSHRHFQILTSEFRSLPQLQCSAAKGTNVRSYPPW